VLYQHSLAFLLGLQGTALLRAFNGHHDRDFTNARLAEIRALLDNAEQFGDGVTTRPVTTAEGYDVWAADYDDPNDLIEMEQPVTRRIIDRLPIGTALDAACGTGRHAAYLASLGHSVTGVDISAGMLDVARAKVPQADFRQGDLHQLPVPDQHADLVVCSLALTHVPELAPVPAEFARVLRPGGHLVIADSRMSYPIVRALAEGGYGYLPHFDRHTSEYLTAALPLGLQVRHCEEQRSPLWDPAAVRPVEQVLPDHPSDIWTLSTWCPAASRAARSGAPLLIFWHFQLSQPPG
jgi:ubiquinone/menaquinone biosynthesis C-methylase UbiE